METEKLLRRLRVSPEDLEIQVRLSALLPREGYKKVPFKRARAARLFLKNLQEVAGVNRSLVLLKKTAYVAPGISWKKVKYASYKMEQELFDKRGKSYRRSRRRARSSSLRWSELELRWSLDRHPHSEQIRFSDGSCSCALCLEFRR